MLTPARRRCRAAVLLPLLGLAALVLPAGASAAPAITCATGTTPLGAATGYTEFVSGNGTRGSESEGSVAYGGDLNASGMTVGTRLSVAKTAPTLVVNGKANGGFNLQAGSAYVPNLNGYVNFNSGGGKLTTAPIDFDAAFTDLKARSASWDAVAANGTADVVNSDVTGTSLGGNVLWLRGTDASINVFHVTPAQVTGIKATFIDVPAGATALIDVSGTSVQVDGETRYRSGSTFRQADDSPVADAVSRTIWNFASATSVKLNTGSAWGGTILAPLAAVNAANVGHNNGQVIAASFTSNFETHQFPFPSSGCVPGATVTPPPPTKADVSVTKTASASTPQGGDALTYTLTAKNAGPATAKNVIVTDALPPGVTYVSASSPCTYAAGIVTCKLGELASGAGQALSVKVTVDPIAAVATVPHPGATHLVPVTKVEQQVDLDAGQTKTVSLTCDSGQILTDGDLRVDAVDQGTGTLAAVHVLSSASTGTSTWQGVVRNDATGRAQAKAFGVCVAGATSAGDGGHTHALVVSAPVTATVAWAAGHQSATLACPSGSQPIVPGYAFSGGAATVSALEPGATAGTWRFDADVTAPTSATLSMRCLNTTVATVDGHTHALKLAHVATRVTVPAGQTVEGQVICADDAKGIVGSYEMSGGVLALGNDARPKTRAYRLYNPTGADATVLLDLECLSDRTGPETVGGTPAATTIVNTATIATDSEETDVTNDKGSATITVSGNGAAVLGSAAVASASSVTLRAACPQGGSSCKGRLSVASSAGTTLATKAYTIRPGRTAAITLLLNRRGRAALKAKGRHTAKVTLTAAGAKKAKAKTITITR